MKYVFNNVFKTLINYIFSMIIKLKYQLNILHFYILYTFATF